jgi:DNA-binding XRE family transcriptional regulator
MYATDSRFEAIQVRLKVEAFNSLTAEKGATSPDDQAALCGVHRATLYRWLAGASPTLALALQVAKALDASVEDIWEGVS